jgi:predicted nucleic acid-binding protein
MSVLVDTGVWLRFLRGEQEGLVAQTWITGGQALVHPFVVGELMLGGLSATSELHGRQKLRSEVDAWPALET